MCVCICVWTCVCEQERDQKSTLFVFFYDSRTNFQNSYSILCFNFVCRGKKVCVYHFLESGVCFFLSCRFPGLNAGFQVWQQASLATETSHGLSTLF